MYNSSSNTPVVPVVIAHNIVFLNKSVQGFLPLANTLNNSFRLSIFFLVLNLISTDSAVLSWRSTSHAWCSHWSKLCIYANTCFTKTTFYPSRVFYSTHRRSKVSTSLRQLLCKSSIAYCKVLCSTLLIFSRFPEDCRKITHRHTG